MTRISLPLTVFATLLCLFSAMPAQAQATRTWVSGVGDDVNPCSRTAPCKTFAGAISKTALNGEINCLDPGGFGTVTIIKSITIDCHVTFGSILNSGTNGIFIPFDSFTTAGETRYIVRLRGLNFNGADTGVNGIRITATNRAGGVVIVEDCLIDGNFGGSARGISDERTAGGELYISNTTVRNTGATGIVIGGGAVSQTIDATLHNVRVENSNYGVAISSGAKVMVNNSVFAGNTVAGLYAEGFNGASELNVNNSVSSNNDGAGVQNGGGTTTIRISNSDIAFNGTAITGVTSSFSNNRISGNVAVGTAPTPIGTTSNPTGLQ